MKGRRWLIGNGTKVSICKEGDGPLEEFVTGDVDDMMNWNVDRLISDDRQWDLSRILHVLPQACIQQILAIPILFVEERDDRLVWSGESSGIFSAKSAFSFSRMSMFEPNNYRMYIFSGDAKVRNV